MTDQQPNLASASASDTLVGAERTPIAQLHPDISHPNSRIVEGEVTITWPFSIVTKSIAFKLVESDFRLRLNKGQVRVDFHGPAAKAVAKATIGGGDEIRLSLDGAEWVKTSPPVRPDTLEWQLSFTNRLRLKLLRAESRQEELINVEASESIDQDPPSQPTTEIISPSTPEPSPPDETIPLPKTVGPGLPNKRLASSAFESDEYASPAFLKRARVSYGSLFEGGADPFDDDRKGPGRTKRSRFSMHANWRYASRTPSPELEHQSDAEEDHGEPEPPEDQRPAAPVVSSPPLPMIDEGCQTQVVDVSPSMSAHVATKTSPPGVGTATSPAPKTTSNEAISSVPAPMPETQHEEVWGYSRPTHIGTFGSTRSASQGRGQSPPPGFNMSRSTVHHGPPNSDSTTQVTTTNVQELAEEPEADKEPDRQPKNADFYETPMDFQATTEPPDAEDDNEVQLTADDFPHDIVSHAPTFAPSQLEQASWATLTSLRPQTPVHPTHSIDNPFEIIDSSSPARAPSPGWEHETKEFEDQEPEGLAAEEEEHGSEESEGEDGGDLAGEDYDLRNYDDAQDDDVVESDESSEALVDESDPDQQAIDFEDDEDDESEENEEERDELQDTGTGHAQAETPPAVDNVPMRSQVDIKEDEDEDGGDLPGEDYDLRNYDRAQDDDIVESDENSEEVVDKSDPDKQVVDLESEESEQSEGEEEEGWGRGEEHYTHGTLQHGHPNEYGEFDADGEDFDEEHYYSERYGYEDEDEQESDYDEEEEPAPKPTTSQEPVFISLLSDSEDEEEEGQEELPSGVEAAADQGSQIRDSSKEHPEPGPATAEPQSATSPPEEYDHAESPSGTGSQKQSTQSLGVATVEHETRELGIASSEGDHKMAIDEDLPQLSHPGHRAEVNRHGHEAKDIDDKASKEVPSTAPEAASRNHEGTNESAAAIVPETSQPEGVDVSMIEGADTTLEEGLQAGGEDDGGQVSGQAVDSAGQLPAGGDNRSPPSEQHVTSTSASVEVHTDQNLEETEPKEVSAQAVAEELPRRPSGSEENSTTIVESHAVPVDDAMEPSKSRPVQQPPRPSSGVVEEVVTEVAVKVKEVIAEEVALASEEKKQISPPKDGNNNLAMNSSDVKKQIAAASPPLTQTPQEEIVKEEQNALLENDLEAMEGVEDTGRLPTPGETQGDEDAIMHDEEDEGSEADYSFAASQQIMAESQAYEASQRQQAETSDLSHETDEANTQPSAHTNRQRVTRSKSRAKPERDVLITAQSLRSWDHRRSISSVGTDEDPSIALAKTPEGTAEQDKEQGPESTSPAVRVTRSKIDEEDPSVQIARSSRTPTRKSRRDATPDPSITLANAPKDTTGQDKEQERESTSPIVRATRRKADDEDPSVHLAKASRTPTRKGRRYATPEPSRETGRLSHSLQSKSPESTTDLLQSPSVAGSVPDSEEVSTLKSKLVKDLRTNLPYCHPLKSLRSLLHKTADFIGIATTTPEQPHRPKSGPRDYILELILTDPASAPSTVTVAHIYRPHQASLPTVHAGDIVLLRRFEVVSMKGRGFGIRSCDDSSWAVFEKGVEEKLPQIKGPPVELEEEIIPYARDLRKWWGTLDEKAMGRIEKGTQKAIQAGKENRG
ncbi:hypothetical protein ACO1O0_009068 [Amphichorda felina]